MKSASLLLALVVVAGLSAAGASSPRIKQFEAWTRADSNGDGRLSRWEARLLPRLARHFDAIDSSGDGVISGAEVRAWRDLTRGAKRATAPKGADEILRIADHDGDGALSRAEFEQGLPRHARRFDRIDSDRDGRLAASELGRWLESLRGARRSKQPLR